VPDFIAGLDVLFSRRGSLENESIGTVDFVGRDGRVDWVFGSAVQGVAREFVKVGVGYVTGEAD